MQPNVHPGLLSSRSSDGRMSSAGRSRRHVVEDFDWLTLWGLRQTAAHCVGWHSNKFALFLSPTAELGCASDVAVGAAAAAATKQRKS